MDNRRMENMVERIAAETKIDPLNEIDSAIDIMIEASQMIENNIDQVQAQTAEEKEAIGNIKEIMSTAINPYIADIIEEMEKFEE